MHGTGSLSIGKFKYTGDFRFGKFHGNGTLETTEFRWAGEWKKGLKHGVL